MDIDINILTKLTIGKALISKKEKKVIILSAEEEFAYKLAKMVLVKPKLSVWMILIPIIVIFHMYRHKKVVSGQKEFAENYLISRKRALNEALQACESERNADIGKIVELADIPLDTKEVYAEWLTLLVAHYQDLIMVEGNNFGKLIKSAYKSRSGYLLFLNRLNQVEKNFNSALKPHLYQTTEAVDEIVASMEKNSEELRRIQAKKIFRT